MRIQLEGWYEDQLKQLSEESDSTPTALIKQFITDARSSTKEREDDQANK